MTSETDILEVSPRDYHTRLQLNREDIFAEDSWMSKSKLWELKDSSLFRWRYYPNEFAGSKFSDWGTLIDCLVTTPDEFDDITAPCPYPNFKTTVAQEFRDELRAAGKIILDETGRRNLEMPVGHDVFEAAEILMADPIAGPVIKASKKQVILTMEIQGVRFKALLDLAPENEAVLYDIKTTSDLSFSGMSKKIASLGYHVQAYLYLKLWNAAYPNDQRKNFRLIWQGQNPPYEVVVTEIPAADIEAGGEWAASALDRLIEAAKADKWPNLAGDRVVMLGRPGWAQFQDDEDIEGPISAPNIKDNQAA